MADQKGLSSVDLHFLAKEMQGLIGGVFRKVYQYGPKSKQLMFDIYRAGKGGIWLYSDEAKIFLTKTKQPAPTEPPNFCMALRKYFTGKRIRSVRQLGFDRVLEIGTDGHFLIFELVRPGNVIICDLDYNIILPMHFQRWKDRTVTVKAKYSPPPRAFNTLVFDEFSRGANESDKKTVAWLAKDAGLGKVYANWLCEKVGIDKDKPAKELLVEGKSQLHKELENILLVPQPALYNDKVTPFPVGGVYKPMESFSQALDVFFSKVIEEKGKGIIEGKEKQEKERVQRIISEQERAKERLSLKASEEGDVARLIYNHYGDVEKVLRGIDYLRDKYEWPKIKEGVEGKGIVKEIKENEGKVIVVLDGQEVALFLNKSVEQNAAMHFEGAKTAKRKVERTEKAQEKMHTENEKEKKKVVVTKVEEGKWYQKYKWFVTSDGFPVVSGKDADQNENLVKKHVQEGDLVFHADIQGAGFTVIKAAGKRISEEAKKEASVFSAVNSKAWQKGLGTIDVYAVKPSQLSKTAKSGEFVGKGAFIVTGKREWFRNTEVRLCVGLRVNGNNIEILSGPEGSLKAYADYYAKIRPGSVKAPALAKKVKAKILNSAKKADLETLKALRANEFERFLPGKGAIED